MRLLAQGLLLSPPRIYGVRETLSVMRSPTCQECSCPITQRPSGRPKLYCDPCKKDARARQQRAWHQANPERSRELRTKASLKHRFNITPEEHAALLAPGCGICGTHADLVIDHNHDTGAVRGALCRSCNTGIGQFRDDRRLVLRAAAYLTLHDPTRAARTP